jgi:argininosuccinate lyase
VSTRRKTTARAGGLIRSRFSRARLPEVEAFTASLPFDRRLYAHDIRGSVAHARMLRRVGLLSARDLRAIERGLAAIKDEIEAGRFKFDVSDEDIHLAIERRLIAIAGDSGRKLHTARSRNDQVALDLRMYLRDEIASIIALIDGLRRTFASIARRELHTIMPGYTHLQRAQPVTLAHHLMAYVEMFGRDANRMRAARDSASVMPLGAGALAGTTLAIDRKFVARELGFTSITRNSIDAVSDRDFALDFLAASSICEIHLSRLSEEIVFWSTAEFGFAELPDEFSTGSSMMPQKKNPDLLELIRGKTGRVIGDLMAMLTTLKGLPLAYNSDLQEDKERVFDAIDTLKPSIDLIAKLMPALKFDRARMAAAAGGPALATDLAEYLVARGMAFRGAHEIVGAIVKETSAAGKSLEELTDRDLARHSRVFGPGAAKILSAKSSVLRRNIAGGPAPSAVRDQIREALRR